MNTNKIKRWSAIVAQGLILLQVAIILLSWIITAAKPELQMRSLLSSEGLRWLFGSVTDNLTTPMLTFLLLLSMAYGAVVESGLLQALRPTTFRQRFALRVVTAEVLLFLLVLFLLTAVPHAVLLSATGVLIPSSFTDGILPILALFVMLVAATYGMVSAKLPTVVAVIESLTVGIARWRWVFLFYFLFAELYASILYVFAH
ncbi:MAG: ABC transporter substrate-binding protein [Prevotella sp.]|nr:ABC transporter substrate-binding protein [Prevotella sp.]